MPLALILILIVSLAVVVAWYRWRTAF